MSPSPSQDTDEHSHPDVVVIGGGIAGVSVAHELAADASVLLVEGETELARHATGRSAASYIPGHGAGPVRALIAASRARFDALAEEAGYPFLRPRPVLWTAHEEAEEETLAASVAELGSDPDVMAPVAVRDARCWWPALREDRLRAAAVTRSAADVDALDLHQHWRRGLRARGGTVRAGAAVTSLAPRRGGGWTVGLGADLVDTGAVVIAAGAWSDRVAALAGAAPVGFTAYRRTIAVARVPAGAAVHRDGPFVIAAGETWYAKPEGEHLLVSPSEENPVEPGDARSEEVDVALALERVNDVTDLGLRSVVTSWTGLRTFAPDRLLVVGARPEQPGLHYFAGQGGYGIESSPASAALAASVVRGEPPPPDVDVDPALFAPPPTSPPPGVRRGSTGPAWPST